MQPLYEEVQRAGQTPVVRAAALGLLPMLLFTAFGAGGPRVAVPAVLGTVLCLWVAARWGCRVRVAAEGLEVTTLLPWQGDAASGRGRRWAWNEVVGTSLASSGPPRTGAALLDPHHLFSRSDVVGFWHRDHVVVEARHRRPLKVGSRDPAALLVAIERARAAAAAGRTAARAPSATPEAPVGSDAS